MKLRTLLAVLMMAVFAFAGCDKDDDAAAYTPTTIEQAEDVLFDAGVTVDYHNVNNYSSDEHDGRNGGCIHVYRISTVGVPKTEAGAQRAILALRQYRSVITNYCVTQRRPTDIEINEVIGELETCIFQWRNSESC